MRSSVRYWMASAICSAPMVSLSARSAIVRATRRMRSWARAVRPSRSKARRKTAEASSVSGQNSARSEGGMLDYHRHGTDGQNIVICGGGLSGENPNS